MGHTQCEMNEGPWGRGGRGQEAECWVVALGSVAGDSRGWGERGEQAWGIHWYVTRGAEEEEEGTQTTKGHEWGSFRGEEPGRRATGPPSHQGNTGPSHRELPFPTQSDGRKVKKPGDAKCWKGQGARADGVGRAQPGGTLQVQETQPGTAAGCVSREGGGRPLGVLIPALHAVTGKSGLGLGTGLGQDNWGLHFYL